MRKFLLSFVIVVLVLILVGVAGIFYLSKDIKVMEDTLVGSVDVSLLEDGTYIGEFELGRFSNKLEVVIESGEITAINVIETVKFERSEVTLEMIEQVIENQDLEIDGVAGATATITAYLKAIEDALKG